MSRKFLTPIDLSKNELLNARIQNLSSAPSSPVAGQTYYDTTLGKLGVYDGTTWDYMGTSEATGDVSSNTSSSVDGEIALFSGTGGKTIKRATGTGIAKLTDGVLSTATAGTDYLTDSSSNTLTNKSFDANGTGNSISNLEVADFASGVVDTDGALSSDSDSKIPTQKAVKTYVDASVTGLSWKNPVRVATTVNGTLATAFANSQTVDGVTLATGDRILIKDQSDATENGIYVVAASGAPSRASDADTGAELKQATVVVQEGTANADSTWTLSNDGAITVGSTNLLFVLQGTGSVPDASTTVKGKVELATQAEAQAKSSSTLALTPASVADFTRKYTATIGDGSSTSIAVTHGLGSQYVTAQAFEDSSGALVECDITLTSSTQTTFGFAVAPLTNAIRVVVIG